MTFTNKTILITGASSGIGKASAELFAKNGANIILVARDEEKLNKVNQEISHKNIKTLACRCDVSDKNQVKQMTDTVIEKFDKIDVLVNNAGFAIYGSVSNTSIDDIESQMRTNYLGMVYCTKNLLPYMLKQKSGHIVNVASVAASFGLPGIASYCASKFAMLGFSEGLKHELKGTGVDVTVVSPIMVRTNFFDNPSFENMPKNTALSLSAENVAKAIVKASTSSRLEIIVPRLVRGVVWAKHTLPDIVNPVVGNSFKKQLEKSNQPE